MTNRPYVDWMTVHSGDRITVQRHPESHCAYIEVWSSGGKYFKLHLSVYASGDDSVPEIEVLPDHTDEEADEDAETDA